MSVGCHYRENFPNKSELKFLPNFIQVSILSGMSTIIYPEIQIQRKYKILLNLFLLSS